LKKRTDREEWRQQNTQKYLSRKIFPKRFFFTEDEKMDRIQIVREGPGSPILYLSFRKGGGGRPKEPQ
jgi:hypothetical protein